MMNNLILHIQTWRILDWWSMDAPTGALAYSRGRKQGLTNIQVDYKITQLNLAIENNRTAIECKHCQKIMAYCYSSFSKRGGTKRLYCCRSCFYSWNTFECEEEDYDFLPN